MSSIANWKYYIVNVNLLQKTFNFGISHTYVCFEVMVNITARELLLDCYRISIPDMNIYRTIKKTSCRKLTIKNQMEKKTFFL